MTPGLPVLAVALASGLALGSFAVTGGLRMSRGGSALVGRSACDACGRSLGFVETLPLLSFARARGACRTCRAPIDRTHLVGELAGAAVIVSAFLAGQGLRTGLLVALGLVLVATATVDWKVRRLPDVLTLAVAGLGLALALMRSAEAAIAGAGAATVSLVVLLAVRAVAGRGGRDPGLGLGDVKLIAALALWLGLGTPWMVACAAGLGLAMMLLLRPVDRRLAFGPAIAMAAWIVGLSQEAGLWPTMA